MHVYGIGCDIIEVERIRQALNRQPALLTRLFTPQEISYCQRFSDPFPRYTGRFAAKEAISKALGTGICEKLSWLDIDILSEPNAAPCVILSPHANAHFPNIEIKLSISHTQLNAVAYAMALTPLTPP